MKLISISILIICAVSLTFACSQSDSSETTPETETVVLTEAEVISKSGGVMETLKSFHFSMTHEVGVTEFLPGLDVEETSGDVQPPDCR